MTFFKQVYRRHSNFAMESVRQEFMSKPTLDARGGQFTCRIARVADLLQEVHLVMTLPDIYSYDMNVTRNGVPTRTNYRFRWVRNVGQRIIHMASVRLDSQLIDQLYGEWLVIWNELAMSVDKRDAYDTMTGNVADLSSPSTPNGYVHIINNKIVMNNYPVASRGHPSIRGRRIVVPLPFWFTQNPSLALPLVALQYQLLEVTLELRPVAEMYQVYDDTIGRYVSPGEYVGMHPSDHVTGEPSSSVKHIPVSLANFTFDGSTSIDLNAYLDCNFIYLDDAERRLVALQPRDVLVDRVQRAEIEGIGNVEMMQLMFSNPLKELVFVLRRDDAILRYNDWTNFTATLPEPAVTTPVDDILGTAKILVNGMERFEEKTVEYFGMIQPYQHHTRIPKRGIMCYSFARNPERGQPSGTLNASKIARLQMYITIQAAAQATGRTYQLVVYGLGYNVFRVMAGNGSMVFVN